MPKFLFEVISTAAKKSVPVPGSFPDGLSSNPQWSGCSKVISRFFQDEESAKEEECLDGVEGKSIWEEHRDADSEQTFITQVIYMRPVYTNESEKNLLYSEKDLDEWWMYGMNNVIGSEDESLIEGFVSVHPWTRKYLMTGYNESDMLHEMGKNPDFGVARNRGLENRGNDLRSRFNTKYERRLIFSTPRTCGEQEMSRVFNFNFEETEHGSGLFKPMNGR